MSHDEIPLAHVNDCDKPADQPIEHVREDSATRRGDDAIAEELVAPLLAERSAMAAAIAKLTAEVDGLRLLDETSRLEMERVRAALHARKDETTSVAAARVWGELLTAQKWLREMRDGVLGALGRSDEDPVVAARWARDTLAESLAMLAAARDAALANVDELRAAAALAEERVSKERAEWRADNERLRLEREDVRRLLAAQSNETVTMAAQRVVALSEVRKEEILRQAEQLEKLAPSDGIPVPVSWHSAVARALGMDGPRLPFAALVERAGQLRDDSVAYRSLTGRLIEMLGATGDFSGGDLLDLIADRINGPITDAEDDLLAQVQQLEGDVGALKAALHVATRGQS